MRIINRNHWANQVTHKEGLKKSISVAQVKEVMKIILLDMKEMTLEEIASLLKRVR